MIKIMIHRKYRNFRDGKELRGNLYAMRRELKREGDAIQKGAIEGICAPKHKEENRKRELRREKVRIKAEKGAIEGRYMVVIKEVVNKP